MNSLPQMFEALIRRYPSDSAALLENMKLSEMVALVAAQTPENAAALCARLGPRTVAAIFENLPAEEGGEILEEMSRVPGALALRRISDEHRDEILSALKNETRHQLERMLGFPEATVGGLLDPVYLAVMDDRSVADGLAAVGAAPESVSEQIYLLDRDHHLSGYVTVKMLACSSPGEILLEIRKPLAKILSPAVSLLRMLEDPELRRCGSLPVADAAGVYLGALRRESLYALDISANEDRNKENIRETIQALGELCQLGLGGMVQTAERLAGPSPKQNRSP